MKVKKALKLVVTDRSTAVVDDWVCMHFYRLDWSCNRMYIHTNIYMYIHTNISTSNI